MVFKIRNRPKIVSYEMGYYFKNQGLSFLNMGFLYVGRYCNVTPYEMKNRVARQNIFVARQAC